MNIVGLVPVGGLANRLQPIPGSKALLPVGYRKMPDGSLRPKPVSMYLLEKYRKAGATQSFLILRKGKWDIPAYYGTGSDPDIDMDLAYLIIEIPYGTPYSLDQAYPFVKNDVVLLGFPDIMIGPEDLYGQLLETLEETQADLVVGLYKVESETQARGTDMVETDHEGRITHIFIKPETTSLTHAWVNAAWTPAFTAFMHEYLQKDIRNRNDNPDLPEIYVGHVVQAAVEAGLKVQTRRFDGFDFLDIGTPDGWTKAYKEHSMQTL